MQSSVAAHNKQNKTTKGDLVTVSFDTEEDRIKGVGMIIRSSEWFKANGKNQYVIRKNELDLFKNNNISYSKIK